MTYEKHEQPQGLNDGQAGAGHEPSMQQLSEPQEQAGQQAPEERRDGSMSIIAHLEELRKRLIYSIAASPSEAASPTSTSTRSCAA